MTRTGSQRFVLIGFPALLIGVVVCILWWPDFVPQASPGNESFPSLFGKGATCPQPRASERAAQRLERAARLHVERYPYDPEDGVRAAHLFMQSADCYRAVGAEAEVRRVEAVIKTLRLQIETDYASARLVLDRALRLGRWEIVDREIHRLLGMTRHLPEGTYARWLRETAGRAAAHARLPR